ncbi:hypothetical protein [Aeromonas sobria]|uniref:hypothetical protein n=1 Tax=Aeromonas sobria TaxID=646 RepID=UPI0013968426|nr:hypothetical protein [Aeromonas sobria]
MLLASLRSGLAIAGGTLQGKRLTVIGLKVKLGQDPLAIGYFADIVQRNNDLWVVHHPSVSPQPVAIGLKEGHVLCRERMKSKAFSSSFTLRGQEKRLRIAGQTVIMRHLI